MTAPKTLADRVEAAIPGVEELDRADAALRNVKRPTIVGESDAVRRVVAKLASELFSTGTYPDDAAERIAAAREEQRSRSAEVEAHQEIVEAVKGMRQAAREDATDARLEVLRAELAEIVADALAADEALGDITTAEDAMRAGPEAIAAWTALEGLAGRWQDVTTLHRRELRNSGPGDVEVDLFRRHGVVRDLAEYGWPGMGTDPAHRRPAYPHHGSTPEALVQSTAGLRWAVRAHADESAPEVRMWVPSRDDLHEANRPEQESDLREATHPVRGQLVANY